MSHPWESYRAGTLVAAGLGYATVLPDFDFETYSEAGYVYDSIGKKWVAPPGLGKENKGLGAVGARNYVEHPTFEILSLSWDLKDGKGRRWWRPDFCAGMRVPPHHRLCDPRELCEYVARLGLLEAFNIGFEFTVWNYYCVPVLGWPPLYVVQCRCCMAKSRANAYPGALEDVGDVLHLHERKDEAGDKLIKKLTVPKKPTGDNPLLRWTPFTAGEDFERFYEYNRQDIRTEAEASMRLPDLSARELAIWMMDLCINQRGMQIDRKAVEDCIAVVEQCFAKYNAELQRLTNYTVKNTSEVQKILVWMAHRGVTLYNLDEETLEEALQRKDYPLEVQRVLRLRQMLAFGSVKKLFAFRSHTTRHGRLHDQYVYYGAHTGLWNGRAVQVANLYSGMFKKPADAERALAVIAGRTLELVEYEYPGVDPLEVVASCLRSLIIAAPGHRLISADFSAIQAVGTSCLFNEQWRIDVFRTHGKIYEMMAAMLTGKTLEYYVQYKNENKKHHEDRQTFGKIPVLATDFGAWVGGWKRFGAEKFGDDRAIKDIILRTWKTVPNIVEGWGGQTRNKFNRAPDGSYAQARPELYGLEGAAICAVLNPGTCYNSKPGARMGVLYQMHEDVLYCRPPSGGLIQYHAPRLRKSIREYAEPWEVELSYEGWNSNQSKGVPYGWSRMKLYGGVQTQNVVSHMCREIQADALLALEHRGYPVVMHTHDENVTEVPYGIGSKEEYIGIVRDSLPSWAVCEDGQPWPVKVPDAWEAERYGKWED
jgi:DNA polymerase